MKVKYRPSAKIEFECEASDVKEVITQLSSLSEVFEESECGACKSKNVRFLKRTNKGFDYYEMQCNHCHARLAFGQHKSEAKTLFPKRKDEDGNRLENNGWVKWQPEKES